MRKLNPRLAVPLTVGVVVGMLPSPIVDEEPIEKPEPGPARAAAPVKPGAVHLVLGYLARARAERMRNPTRGDLLVEELRAKDRLRQANVRAKLQAARG